MSKLFFLLLKIIVLFRSSFPVSEYTNCEFWNTFMTLTIQCFCPYFKLRSLLPLKIFFFFWYKSKQWKTAFTNSNTKNKNCSQLVCCLCHGSLPRQLLLQLQENYYVSDYFIYLNQPTELLLWTKELLLQFSFLFQDDRITTSIFTKATELVFQFSLPR